MAITQPIRPPNSGLTEEAKAALNLETEQEQDLADLDGIDSDLGEAETGPPLFAEDTGDFIEDSPLRQKAESAPPPRDASKNMPRLDEWQDFFSRILLRVLCDWYISFAFRGIDEDALTDREVDRLQLTKDERQRIAVPFAELSYKSRLMRRHGRTIIASGGAFDALVTLGAWTSRVNRIARRHKPRTVQGSVYERTGPGTPEGPGETAGANGGRVAGEWTIVNPGG